MCWALLKELHLYELIESPHLPHELAATVIILSTERLTDCPRLQSDRWQNEISNKGGIAPDLPVLPFSYSGQKSPTT